MANKKLGKGLGAIFGDIDSVIDDISNGEVSKASDSSEIAIKSIRPNPYQPRKNFDDDSLKELADSIKENGVFNPILVRKSVNGYELVAGERRLRASKLAGLTNIPCIVVDFDEKQMMEISLLENIQREDLSAIEEAQAYEQLIKRLNYTQEDLAKRIGKSREHVANMLRLLKLPRRIQKMVSDNLISYGHARALLACEKEKEMNDLADIVVKKGISVRELEKLVKGSKKTIKIDGKVEDPFLSDVRHRLESKYSTKVDVSNSKITFSYKGVDDLNRILEIMGGIEEND